MAHHLYQITNPLKQYLSSRFSKQWRLNKSIDLADTDNLPAPLFVAQVRGAAILKECFFKELDQKRRAFIKKKQKESSKKDALNNVMLKAIKRQAKLKNYTW